jgi:hypothetical protein
MINLHIGVVAEGPTEMMLFKALINKLIPGSHHYYELQPPVSATPGFGSHGAGWKGVRGWCEEIGREFKELSHFIRCLNPPLDMLIIQLDTDVAREPEVNCMKPCPPIEETVVLLEKKLLEWIDEKTWSHKIIRCFPADNTEAWVLAAYDPQTAYHDPPDNPLECVEKPDMIISNQAYKSPRRLLKRKKDSRGKKKPKKDQRTYRELIPTVLERWEDVKSICSQASRFEQQVKAYYCVHLKNEEQ